MRDYLIFQLYAALSSWGDIAVGEQRRSFSHPSKSAVLGLIAAALGIRRSDEQRLDILTRSLGFATRVDNDGVLLRDYHTIQTPPMNTGPHRTRREELSVPANKLNTILSSREYRCDAVYWIALWLLPDAGISLDEIRTALVKPHYVLYLGRKSCPPSLPLDPKIMEARESLVDAFAAYDSNADIFLKNILVDRKNYRLFRDIDAVEDDGDEQHRFIRRDQLRSRSRWQFAEREEAYTVVDLPKKGGE